MTHAQRQRAADILWDCWQEGRRLEHLPTDARPLSREDGYAVQALLARRSDAPLVGWKIAATSKAGQAHIAVDGPLAGRLLGERIRPDGGEIPYGNNHMRVGEAEFAFRMGRSLRPRDTAYDVREVLDAVDTFHPAIEVPDSRYEDFTRVGAAQLIADNACAHYFVLGPAAPDVWRSIDLVAHPVRGWIEGGLSREGSGERVLGDPRVALTWLVNELSGIGVTLDAGQVVTTGTCIVPLPIAPGDRIAADFGVLGTVSAVMASS